MRVRSHEFQRLVMGKQCTCRIVQFAIVKNKDFSKNKRQEANWLSQLRIRTALSKIPLVGNTFSREYKKMTAIINNIFLAGDKFMSIYIYIYIYIHNKYQI